MREKPKIKGSVTLSYEKKILIHKHFIKAMKAIAWIENKYMYNKGLCSPEQKRIIELRHRLDEVDALIFDANEKPSHALTFFGSAYNTEMKRMDDIRWRRKEREAKGK